MIDHCAFNGDADGLCALQQLRLAGELDPGVQLVSGVKRDIALLGRVKARPGERVTVLDIAHEQNREDVQRLLADGVQVRYFDHHFAGELPQHPAFDAHIDTAAHVCTSLLVDTWLQGKAHRWAVVAAFGDGMAGPARALAQRHGLGAPELTALAQLGELLNYNAYGDSVADLHFDPLALAAELLPYADPLDFVQHSASFAVLRAGYAADMAAAADFRRGAKGRACACSAYRNRPGRGGSAVCWPTTWPLPRLDVPWDCSAPSLMATGCSACACRTVRSGRPMPSAGSFPAVAAGCVPRASTA